MSLLKKPWYNTFVALHAISMAGFLLFELTYTIKLFLAHAAGEISHEKFFVNGVVMLLLCMAAQVAVTLLYIGVLGAEYLRTKLYARLDRE